MRYVCTVKARFLCWHISLNVFLITVWLFLLFSQFVLNLNLEPKPILFQTNVAGNLHNFYQLIKGTVAPYFWRFFLSPHRQVWILKKESLLVLTFLFALSIFGSNVIVLKHFIPKKISVISKIDLQIWASMLRDFFFVPLLLTGCKLFLEIVIKSSI